MSPAREPEGLPLAKVILRDKLALIQEHWTPKQIGQVNDCAVKLVKLAGEFVWHQHDLEDELFLVLHGRLRMEFRDHSVELNPGELIVVPRGVEHRPVAEEEVHVLLFEPTSTLNTGDADDPRTVRVVERI